MSEQELNRRLEAVKAKQLPDVPSNLEANVMRRIRISKTRVEMDFWSWMGSLIPHTAFVMGALALVVVTSSLVTYASASAHAAGAARKMEVNRALDLGFVKATDLLQFKKY